MNARSGNDATEAMNASRSDCCGLLKQLIRDGASEPVFRLLSPLLTPAMFVNLNDTLETIASVSRHRGGFTIVNTGLLKAGKSSLFNALLETRERFATGDARATVANQEQTSQFGMLIDTPGLDASDADTEEAERVLRTADLVLFVHSMASGEFDCVETRFLTRLAGIMTSSDEFSRRVIPVFQKIDSLASRDLERAVEKSLETWRKTTSIVPSEYFVTSSKRMMRSLDESSPVTCRNWRQNSGIPALKACLARRHKEWRETGADRLAELLDRAFQQLAELIDERIAELDGMLETFKCSDKAQRDRVGMELDELHSALAVTYQE